jgi:predicted RNA-binding Zn-ribbon protein involved in translation (DUF1610 family)
MPFLIFIIFVAVLAAILRLPVVKGAIGEFIVKLIIGKTSEEEGKEKFVVNNFLIELENGKTSQTDHILINPHGVFVIETKNYSGRVYGDDSRKEWTQVFNYGKVKNKFYSPVRQNATHIHHIKELLPPETPIYSAIVFVQGNIQYIESKYVYTLLGLRNYVQATKETHLSLEEMKAIYEALSLNNKSDVISNSEHVENIRKMQEDIANNICPRCGASLVIRTSNNRAFYGCSNYPNCTFTKKL